MRRNYKKSFNKLVLTILVIAIAVYYDPKVISFKELVNVFFASQDPTTPNQQRSWFFLSLYCLYKNAAEKKIIEDKIKELTANKVFANPIVTEVKPVTDFMKQRIIIKIM
jgi:peptide-methionine (S)-S-oxide reductase